MSTAVTTEPATTPRMSAEEFVRVYQNRRYELVQGAPVEVARPSPKHGKTCSHINFLLWQYAATNDCGHVMGNDSFVQTTKEPDGVRGADVCYYSYERLPKGEIPEGMLPVPPNLVVEVRSPSDTWNKIFTKVGEYLGAGVSVVIVLDPASESASVYRMEDLQQIFHNSDELVVPDVLPGFAVVVRLLFV